VTQTHDFRYDLKTLQWDYVRAVGGAFLCFTPLVLIEVVPVMVCIFAIVGAVFTLFGLRTLLRHMTEVELSAQGLRTIGPMSRAIRWDALNGMKLAFYSARRRTDNRSDFAASKGWMELKLKGPEGSIALDSSLDGFDAIVDTAFRAALGNNLQLNETTLANLDAMGFTAGAGTLPDDHL
tara:strand:+ start:2442 stop:2981 length:540 start_codon:yes stop_codon:yes gene_type:complete